MVQQTQSLAHTKWLCKYHIVFSPKYRRKVIFNQIKASVIEILKVLCKYKGVEIVEEGGGTPTSGSKWALVNLILAVVGGIAALFTLVRVFLKKNKKTNMLWLAATVIAGIVGIIVFILTENMNNPMTLVDWWTILNFIILIIGLLGVCFTFNTENKTSKLSHR